MAAHHVPVLLVDAVGGQNAVPLPEIAQDDSLDILFVINRGLDLLFICDMCLSCMMGFREVADKGGQLVYDSKRIRARYLRTWFALDLLACIPFEILGQLVESQAAAGPSP